VTLSSTAVNRRPAGGIRQARDLLAEGGSPVTGHVQSVLAAIAEANSSLAAFVSVAGDEALAEAEAADKLIARLGAAAWERKPLLGITVSVKDLIQTRDLPTRRGSLLSNHRPRADAPAVARLRAAGAIVVGKTATSEYGWSASTVSRLGPPTRNPWNPGLSAGGSSGGAAAAVAAGLCSLALGTDGAGSVRIPAAFCGVAGFKPSFGRIPYLPPCADRLAHLGPLAGSVADVAAAMAVLAGPHPGDPDSAAAAAGGPVPDRPLRIAWIEFPGTTAEVAAVSERAWPVLAGHGHRVERTAVPFADPYPALVDILAAAEAAGTAPQDEPRCDPGRAAVARYGRTVSGAAVLAAEETRMALRVTLARVMEHYDLLAMATVGIEPFGAREIGPPGADSPAGLRWLAWSPATYPFNLTGQPALSLPVGLTAAGMPVGLQLVGPVGGDDLVLAAAGRLEADLGFPPVPAGLATKG
jgi:aspartyl-tRNA(Asn)/glutamyl-tRNA(Gln) amidotransferase subunit A